MTDIDRQLLVLKLHEANLSMRAIAKRTGMARGKVSELIRCGEVKRKPGSRHTVRISDAQVAANIEVAAEIRRKWTHEMQMSWLDRVSEMIRSKFD